MHPPGRQRRPARGEQQTAGRPGDALPPGAPALLPAAGARGGAGAKHACGDTSAAAQHSGYMSNNFTVRNPPTLTVKSSPNSARCSRLTYTSSLRQREVPPNAKNEPSSSSSLGFPGTLHQKMLHYRHLLDKTVSSAKYSRSKHLPHCNSDSLVRANPSPRGVSFLI